MIRLLAIILLLLTSGTALAATEMNLPNFFTPVEQDLSVWYLGSIFGDQLIAGDNIPSQALMSRLFGIFNQVALVVGIMIIIYTMLTGTLNTANEGKPLGEKWNSMWMPIRSLVGISLLVPKGGSGYVMSQYIVMWLTLQGIGAADTVWTTMVEFFEQGGGVRTYQTGGQATYMNVDTMSYTYALQSPTEPGFGSELGRKRYDHFILEKMVCIDAFNADEEMVELSGGDRYSVYIAPGENNIINFGNRNAFDPDDLESITSRKAPGAECGQIRVKLPPDEKEDEMSTMSGAMSEDENYDARTQIYTNALYNLARGLSGVSRDIVDNYPDEANWDPVLFDEVNRNTQLFINYIVGYQQILDPPQAKAGRDYEILKRYGWILAGNYYTMLANLNYDNRAMSAEFVVPDPMLAFHHNTPGGSSKYSKQAVKFMEDLTEYDDLYKVGDKNAAGANYDAEDGSYDVDGALDKQKTLNFVDVDAMISKVREKHTWGPNSSKTTRNRVEDFTRYLSGSKRNEQYGSRQVAQDPIIRAASYGKELTDVAVALFLTLVPLLVGLNIIASWKTCLTPEGWAIAGVTNVLVPTVIALAGFLYTQGAMLGVFLPLIPFITFYIGVLGWMMQVVESIAAAPIVAIGLIFPETRDDIWGRAAPAYMLILNLFLRPSLMIVGFAAAMIMMWIAVELLNIGFLVLTASTFRIEDMFGFVTIMLAYSALLITVATKVYSLINMVPNKVLHWIGDQSMGTQGAEEAIGGAKQGAEAGASSAAAGYSALQSKSDMYRGERDMERSRTEAEKKAATAEGDKPPDDKKPEDTGGAEGATEGNKGIEAQQASQAAARANIPKGGGTGGG